MCAQLHRRLHVHVSKSIFKTMITANEQAMSALLLSCKCGRMLTNAAGSRDTVVIHLHKSQQTHAPGAQQAGSCMLCTTKQS